MKIEVVVTSHFFQRRLCWMASSMLQQQGDFELILNAAYVEGTGDPKTADVLDFFHAEGLTCKHTNYPDHSILQYRGYVRNRQLAESDADWMIFADSDMVFPPGWFASLAKILRAKEDENRMMFTGRFSTPVADTNRLVDARDYPCIIPMAWGQASELRLKKRRNCGAGFCQIISVANMRETHGGIYANPKNSRDWPWRRRQKARSDVWFRRRVGKLKIKLPFLIHLNHIRDVDRGKHTEEQR